MKNYLFLLIIPVLLFSGLVQADNVALETELCKKSTLKFMDGDTFKCNGETVRVLGVDTPEVKSEGNCIYKDQKMGKEASEFTKKELLNAKRILLIKGEKDVYGRRLAHVMIDGDLLAAKLIKAGLGYETISRFGTNGFELYATDISSAVNSSPKPKFKEPYVWREQHKKEMNCKR